MTTFMLIHGAYGHPDENWFPWLKSELEKADHEVIVPLFPTPEDQNLITWLSVFNKYKQPVDVFIGHSLGPAFILTLLETHKAKAAVLVAGFASALGNDFDKINKTFIDKKFNWDAIRGNCRQFIIINSDNDPYVGLQKGAELAERLKSELLILKEAGHINEAAGYSTFKFLLEKMRFIKK